MDKDKNQKRRVHALRAQKKAAKYNQQATFWVRSASMTRAGASGTQERAKRSYPIALSSTERPMSSGNLRLAGRQLWRDIVS